jgi:predicted amidophosphoribosyltransferase
MIFLDSAIDSATTIVSLGDYHPYWLDQVSRIRNPRFDAHSDRVLNLKYREDLIQNPQAWKINKKRAAIEHFHRILEPMLSNNLAIAVVPSSRTNSASQGIRLLAQRLAATDERIDATVCLVRHKGISKQATGGKREIENHLRTIRLEYPELIGDREVLLLDDITTSGRSLAACQQILEEAGASRVKCAVLGRTIDE